MYVITQSFHTPDVYLILLLSSLRLKDYRSSFLHIFMQSRLYHSPCHNGLGVLHFGILIPTGISAIVVESNSIRIFSAYCPILKLFKPYPYKHISSFCFGIKALRGFKHIRRNTLQCFHLQRAIQLLLADLIAPITL